MATDHCVICDLTNQHSDNAGRTFEVRVHCERCGTFEWKPPYAIGARPKTSEEMLNLSAFVREQNAIQIVPLLTAELMEAVKRRPRPRLRERAMRALTAIVKDVGYDIYGTFPINKSLSIQAISYCSDEAGLSVLFEILEEARLIKTVGSHPTSVCLTPAGLIQAEELSQAGVSFVQGFVAMSFDVSMNEAYTQGFDPGILAAGYRPFRIDGKQHINGISDEILTEIRRSRFLVADYTLMNNGVYFEAGVAIGLGIPVIATCHTDHFDKLHFDIRHINTLKWDTSAQLARDLEKRISGVIGKGPLSRERT